MTNFNPLAPELLEKMWAVYYHRHKGRGKKKTFLSNATELIKLMQTAIPEESQIPKKYKADAIKYGFDFDMWGRSEALRFWSKKYQIEGENISKYFYSISSVTTLS